jgi:hypothetical protein
MKCVLTLLLAYLVTSFHAGAAEIDFEIYSRDGRTRTLVVKGQRSYSESDFLVRRELRSGQLYGVSKALELSNGFGLGVLDTLQSADGFGLTVEHFPTGSNPDDFSWEWFDHSESGVFVKRQGNTRIEVEFSGLPLTAQIRSIRFLDDVASLFFRVTQK